jgi:hypothetical protein
MDFGQLFGYPHGIHLPAQQLVQHKDLILLITDFIQIMHWHGHWQELEGEGWAFTLSLGCGGEGNQQEN